MSKLKFVKNATDNLFKDESLQNITDSMRKSIIEYNNTLLNYTLNGLYGNANKKTDKEFAHDVINFFLGFILFSLVVYMVRKLYRATEYKIV